MSFKVENKSEEFVLYMVHESGGKSYFHRGFVARNVVFLCLCVRVYLWSVVAFVCGLVERTRLRDDEYPLVARVLYGPCEKISKILITEADLGEEVTYDVSVDLLPSLSPSSHLVDDT